jgi:hypothetical protein
MSSMLLPWIGGPGRTGAAEHRVLGAQLRAPRGELGEHRVLARAFQSTQLVSLSWQ